MTTKTASVSGNASSTATWGGAAVPVDGDAVVINLGITVLWDIDKSTLTNGFASFTNNGIVHFSPSVNTGIKFNTACVITGTGALYVAHRAVTSGFTLTTGKTNTYQVATTVWVQAVEETLGNPYLLEAQEQLIEQAINTQNALLDSEGLPEMLPPALQTFINTTKANLTLDNYIAYVEANPGSFYCDQVGGNTYIHTTNSSNPSTKTITLIDPIQRPASGSSSRCNLIFLKTTATITQNYIQIYGWYPQNEWSQLSAGASLNATTLPALNVDMGLQVGDQIVIGSGTENYNTVESAECLYTISAYNPTTKIITLSSGLQTARLTGDFVAIYNRPINITANSDNPLIGAMFGTPLNNVKITGLNTKSFLVQFYGYLSNMATGWKIKHSTLQYATNTIEGLYQGLIQDCTVYNSTSLLQYNISTTLKRVIAIDGENLGVNNELCSVQDSIMQNNWAMSNINHKNCILRNFGNIADYDNTQNGEKHFYKNCDFLGGDSVSPLYKNMSTSFMNCIFHDNSGNYVDTYADANNGAGYFANFTTKLYNCLFNGTTAIGTIQSEIIRRVDEIIESIDHNQIVGNYAAWMLGGTITTQLNGSTPLINKLTFNPISSTAPVFRDFKFTVPANKLMKPFNVPVTLSALGMTMQLQIIDPANDPLIDSSASPLETVNAANVTTAQNLSINYKSTVAKELILRVLCQAASGTVNVDVTQIMQHGAKPPIIVKR